MRITKFDAIPEGPAAIIDHGLGDFNSAAAPLSDVHPLACFASANSGEIIGGVIGRTWGTCCELQQLWVEPNQRRRGIGTDLVKAFEEHAAERGCTTCYLETFSFQAPSLYQSLGYEIRLSIKGFGLGIEKYVMVHELAQSR
jgi:ribosomal protein S18 acetylase RimI-like enzyme